MIYFLLAFTGIIAGAGLIILVLWKKLPKMMIREAESRYTMEETMAKLLELTSEKGWKVPATHDLQATMEKNSYRVLPVMVYELCKPSHAYEILSRDNEKVVSSLMPCRISVYQKSNGKVYISRLNSGLMAKSMKGVVPRVMNEATMEMEEIISKLKA